MAQLEAATVQLLEARRLADFGDSVHGRLALLLLDNAAEISMRRTARTTMAWAEIYNNAELQLRDVDAEQDGLRELLTEIGAHTVSRSLARRVDRDFEALVDFVCTRTPDSLPLEHGECLKILHRYRNAAYHRDSVRPDVLGPAVDILFFLTCHLIKNEHQIVHELGVAPPAVLQFLGQPPQEKAVVPNGYSASGLANSVADVLLESLNLDHGGIAVTLSNHLLGRLKQLETDLETIGQHNLPTPLSVTLRLVQQAPQTQEEFDQPLAADFWTRDLPVTEQTLTGWRTTISELRQVTDARGALRTFAVIEQPMEALEALIGRWLEDIDREEQARIDWLRGR